MENQSFDHNVEVHSGECLESRWLPRKICTVPPQLRQRRRKQGRVYNPRMVSLGPYHHENDELRLVEEFKRRCLDWCANGDEALKVSFHNKILEEIKEIRDCYAETTIVNKYDDNALANMMLLDACFIIIYIKNCVETERTANILEWFHYLGRAATVRFVARDIMVLENQIPFSVVKMLTSFMYEENKAKELLEKFLSWITLVDLKQVKLTIENGEPPIHLLEACWRVLVDEDNYTQCKKTELDQFQWSKTEDYELVYKCRSVMDLKAKGIRFRPSSAHYLKDVTFNSHALYGQLQLPVRYVSERTQVILSNMIAYEVSPNSNVRPHVLSYTNFMKALIQSPEDVKELQENGLLLNRFVNHEKVVKMFKNIDTFGLLDLDTFIEVKQKIEKHCSDKGKTWMAELIHTRFRTPWTAIAFFAAALLLCLTFLQTYFAIRPAK